MLEENQLRGALTNTHYMEGQLGFKGERGYSAYEIAVLNGYEGTEQDWIDHFGLDLSGYVQTSDVVDNLTSTETTHPLSANQGKILNTSRIYSTKETVIGEWLGKPLYRKVIEFGALPDTSAKNVNHNISNFKRGIKITGYAYSSQSGSSVPIPYASNSNVAQSIVLYCNSTVVGIVTGVDHTMFDECYIVLEYTKTTD